MTPAYYPKLADLAEAGAFPLGVVTQVAIAHDDDCDIWDGKSCNCDPEVTVIPAPTS